MAAAKKVESASADSSGETTTLKSPWGSKVTIATADLDRYTEAGFTAGKS